MAPTSCSAATPSSWPSSELRHRGLDPEESPEEYETALDDAIPRWKKQCDEEAEEVIEAGGLYVLGTERHDSRRIDNQLRGRSGRQGDPGESRFYLSLQDDLMKRFRAGAVEAVMDRLNIPEDVPIESKMVTRQIKSAQTQIEAQNAEIRKDVLKYDEVLNKQRQVIYAERRRVLDGEDLHEQVRHMIDDDGRAPTCSGATADGLRRGLGPRPAVDQPQAALPGRHHHRGAGGGGGLPGRDRRRLPHRNS